MYKPYQFHLKREAWWVFLGQFDFAWLCILCWLQTTQQVVRHDLQEDFICILRNAIHIVFIEEMALKSEILEINLETSYSKISTTNRNKSQNLNDSRLVWQLSLPNPLNPGVKSRMKM